MLITFADKRFASVYEVIREVIGGVWSSISFLARYLGSETQVGNQSDFCA